MRYTRVAIWLHWLVAALAFITMPVLKSGGSGETVLHDAATNKHKLIGMLLVFHNLAALRHQLINRDGVLSRMSLR